jgi:hypothetical protein
MRVIRDMPLNRLQHLDVENSSLAVGAKNTWRRVGKAKAEFDARLDRMKREVRRATKHKPCTDTIPHNHGARWFMIGDRKTDRAL